MKRLACGCRRLCRLWLCLGLCGLQASRPWSPSVPCKMPRCGQELGPGPYWETWLGLPAAGGAGEGAGLTQARGPRKGVSPGGEGGQPRGRKGAAVEAQRSDPCTVGTLPLPGGVLNLSSTPQRAPSTAGLLYSTRILQPGVFKRGKGRAGEARLGGPPGHLALVPLRQG